MSVHKSRRNVAAAQFLEDAIELRRETLRIVKKFPKSYRWVCTNNMLELATEIYTNCRKGNRIFVHKDMSERDFDLRHRYLMLAWTAPDALLGEITFLYGMVDEGNNYLGSRADYNRVFSNWTKLGNTLAARLAAVISSDKERFKRAKAKAGAPDGQGTS